MLLTPLHLKAKIIQNRVIQQGIDADGDAAR